MSPTRALVAPLVGWLAATVAINVAAARLTANSMPRQIVRAIDSAVAVTDVFVGNSLMAAAVDEATLRSERPDVHGLNIALGSTSPIEHDVLAARALRKKPQRVYYGFFDAQLTQPVSTRWSDLSGNRALIYYVDREAAIQLIAPDDPIRAWQIRICARIPLVVERVTLWATVERRRRALAGYGMPPADTNRFGRAQDFALLEPDEATFRSDIRLDGEGGVRLSPAVADLFDRTRNSGARLTVVAMPMPGRHRARFYGTDAWRAYADAVRRAVAVRGGAYIDATAWVDDAGFEDALHVGPAGARRFTSRLLTSVDH